MTKKDMHLSKKDISDKELLMEECLALTKEELLSGIEKERISQKLVKMGLELSNAESLIKTVQTNLIAISEKEKPTPLSLLNGVLGGVLGSLLGGFIWGGITVLTDYEIGYIAWAIGLICGFGVVWFSGGKKGLLLQFFAVLSSVFGILGGKYFIFYHVVKKAVIAEAGQIAAAEVELFSLKLFNYFLEHISTILSGYDVLWVVLAVLTAWKIPAAVNLKIKNN